MISESAQVFIYDLLGKKIYSSVLVGHEGSRELKEKPAIHLAQGVYFIEVMLEGKRLRQKYVVN